MGLGTSRASKSDSIFVDMKTNAKKGEEGVGFRQEIGRETDASGKVQRTYAMHNFVAGHILSFKAAEEPTYDDKAKNEWIGYLTLSEPGEPNVVVRFPMERSSGRRLVGLINAAMVAGDDTVFVRTTYAGEGTKLGNETLTEARAFLTLRAGDSQGEKRDPLFMNAEGQPLVDADGKAIALPAAKVVKIGKVEVKDSSEADEIVLNTAVSLMGHFAAQRDARKQTQGAADGHDDGINPAEAAAAAASPRG